MALYKIRHIHSIEVSKIKKKNKFIRLFNEGKVKIYKLWKTDFTGRLFIDYEVLI